MKKNHWFFFVGLVVIGLVLFFQHGDGFKSGRRTGATVEERQGHQRQLRAIDEYHDHLDSGDKYAKSQDYIAAEKMYLEALSMAKSADGQTVARGVLADFYENIGEYQKAIGQIEWFLSRNLTAPGRARYSEAKERLVKKMKKGSRLQL